MLVVAPAVGLPRPLNGGEAPKVEHPSRLRLEADIPLGLATLCNGCGLVWQKIVGIYVGGGEWQLTSFAEKKARSRRGR